MQTDATLLANYSQNCGMLSLITCCVRFHTRLHLVAFFGVFLGVVAQSLKPVKLLATCKRTQQHGWSKNVVSRCVHLHVAKDSFAFPVPLRKLGAKVFMGH